MPPKNGPATAKKDTGAEDSAPVSDDAASSPPEPSETVEDTAEEQQAPQPKAKSKPATTKKPTDNTEDEDAEADADAEPDDNRTPEQRAKDDIIAMYPKDTDLWFGAVKGLWFGFPRITGITPTRQWLRQIYMLTQVAQTFEWMVLAKVPMLMQARTDALTDDEYDALFNAWFQDGEVTLPK